MQLAYLSQLLFQSICGTNCAGICSLGSSTVTKLGVLYNFKIWGKEWGSSWVFLKSTKITDFNILFLMGCQFNYVDDYSKNITGIRKTTSSL